jgi:hypothetical protein
MAVRSVLGEVPSMKRLRSVAAVLTLVVLPGSFGATRAQTSFTVESIGGMVVLPDGQTLVVSVPSKGTLVYYDTDAEKETKTVELDFKPAALVVHGEKLFVSTKGAATVHILEADTGKEISKIKLPGEPVKAMACHPSKGWVYAVNSTNDVIAIDPEKEKAVKTRAKGQLVAIDGEGKFLYTGIQEPIQDVVVIERANGGRTRISLATTNERALMLKYAVDADKLKLVAANDNAAINGRNLAVSPDGKLVAMAGGGGWQSKKDPKRNYTVAVFDTADMKDPAGQVDTDAYPSAVAFHPVLGIGAVYRDDITSGGELIIFNSTSCARKTVFNVKRKHCSALLGFGGKGTKVICATIDEHPDTGLNKSKDQVIEIFPLELTDKDKEALKKEYPK